MTTKQMMEQLMAQNARILENLDSLNERVTTLESGKTTKATTKKSVSTSSTKGKAKKSETSEPRQTWEEHLTEKFGSKELRTKYAEFRKRVADEFKKLAESKEMYIPKGMYKKVLAETTDMMCKYSEVDGQKCLTVKMSSSIVKSQFTKYAK